MKKNNLNSSFFNSALNYPLDSALILRKKSVIKRELLLNNQLIPKRIAFLSGSTTSTVKDIVELFLLKIGIKPEFYESDFNKFYEEAVFENKGLEQFKPDIIYIHTSYKNIILYPQFKDSQTRIEELLNQEKEKYRRIWTSLLQYQCPIIQNNFDYPQYRILGNLDNSDPHGQVCYINCLNSFFSHEAQQKNYLYIHDINYLAASLGLNKWFDKQLWYSARYALSYEAIPHLAHSLSALIGSLLGIAKKCLALDLDNTCWGGQIGDDGLDGIIIGIESALAEVYTEFQHYLKSLKDRGIILSVCSKNDLANAKMGFTHPDSVLKENDFAAFEADWEPKYKNLIKIADHLNIHLDSIVFIDDNQAERQIVTEALPEVTVPNVGNDVINFIEFIDKNYYFETAGLSMEDINRNDFYKIKSVPIQNISQHLNYADFLSSLEMKAEIKPFTPLYWQRITQLIHKTHQFNLTNKLFSLIEIETISSNPNYLNVYGRLSDCYGDHGLISVIISKILNKECHIELWIMSCRVFKRTMEYAMFHLLIEYCRSLEIEQIIGYYYPSVKNKIVSDLYKRLGFSLIENKSDYSIWCLKLTNYIPQDYYIKIT